MSRKNYTHIFEKIVAEHNTTVEKVRYAMVLAIQAGLQNPDPMVQAQWAKIPRKRDVPTPDELITYVVRQAKKAGTDVSLRRYFT